MADGEDMGPVLVTGSAGFIGFHTALRLLARGETVIGLDNLDPFYDVGLKEARLAQLVAHDRYLRLDLDIADRAAMKAMFERHGPRRIVHLAAQAGVRYSLENPEAYVDSNLVGFVTVLEGCRAVGAEHLVYASTSSVFGANQALPFSVHQGVAHPITLYAATKLANEAMAHAYAHLYGFPCTALRFFTVYGPWGRPDMAPMKFAEAILAGRPIEVFGEGRMQRDFTFVDDVVTGVVAALDRPAKVDPAWNGQAPDPSTSGVAPWRVLNIGAGTRVELMRFIELLELNLGRRAEVRLLPAPPGDVPFTEADIVETTAAVGYTPTTSLEDGVAAFADWYKRWRAREF
jgi:UDP-glucuronate 4-epimerase